MTEGRDLPWLQDTDVNADGQSDVWDVSWGVEYRDVVILDAENKRLGAFNLTANDLADADNYSLLKETVMHVAMENPIWQNDTNPMDVNNDSVISPVGDVLTCINELNNRVLSDSLGNLPVPAHESEPPPYVDVNGDYLISPVGDVLSLINFLNSLPSGEGEGEANLPNDLRQFDSALVDMRADGHVRSDLRELPILVDAAQTGQTLAQAALADNEAGHSRAELAVDEERWITELTEDLHALWYSAEMKPDFS